MTVPIKINIVKPTVLSCSLGHRHVLCSIAMYNVNITLELEVIRDLNKRSVLHTVWLRPDRPKLLETQSSDLWQESP